VSQASQACFVPPSTFLTSSTVCSTTHLASLFHPATTSEIHPSGVLSPTQPYELVTRRCPLAVDARSLPLDFLSPSAPGTDAPPSGLCSVREPVATT
jgi:hypothetical protein